MDLTILLVADSILLIIGVFVLAYYFFKDLRQSS